MNASRLGDKEGAGELVGRRSGTVAIVGRVPEEVCRVAKIDGWDVETPETPEELLEGIARWKGHSLVVVSLVLSAAECQAIVSAVAPDENVRSRLGFVVGENPAQLAMMLRRSRLPEEGAEELQPNAAFVDVSMLASDLPHASGAKRLSCQATAVAGLFSAPRDVLYLSGHSNSQCQGAGSSIALCTRDAAPTVPAGAPQLPCFKGSPCRFDADERVRVRASTLRSRILVNLTCFGHYFSNTPYAAASAVQAGYWSSTALRCVLTTFGPTYVSPLDFLVAYFLVQSGYPTGEVARGMNLARLWRGEDSAIACIGDPDQAVLCTVHRAPAEPSLHGFVVRRPPHAEGACDVRTSVHVPGPGVVAFDGRAVIAGALLPDGELFLSLPSDVPKVSARFVPLAEARKSLDFSQLTPGLEAIEMLLRYVSERVAASAELWGEVSPHLRQAMSIRSSLLDAVRRSRPTLLQAGEIIESRLLSEPAHAIHRRLQALGARMIEVYQLVLAGRGTVFPWQAEYLARASSTGAAESCRYCGGSFSESIFKSVDRRVEERSGECDMCGVLYQGSAGTHWVGMPRRVVAGARVVVEVEVSNLLSTPAPAGGVAVFQCFLARCFAAARFPSVSVPPGATAVLRTELRIPETALVGVQRVCVATVVGVNFSHCRRDVQVVAENGERVSGGLSASSMKVAAQR